MLLASLIAIFILFIVEPANIDTGSLRSDGLARAGEEGCAGGRPYCNVVPIENLMDGGCAQLRRTIEGRQVGDELIKRIVTCETPVIADASEFAAAAMAATLEIEGPSSHGAFLFVRFQNTWRVTDHLLEPAWTHGGYCRTRFKMDWDLKGAKSELILETQSERICHMPLDQKEMSAGESDIATSECHQARYRFAEGRLRKLSESDTDGPCKFS